MGPGLRGWKVLQGHLQGQGSAGSWRGVLRPWRRVHSLGSRGIVSLVCSAAWSEAGGKVG